MEESHEEHPARIGKPFHGFFPDIPYGSESLCYMLSGAHAYHRIVNKREIQHSLYTESRAQDEDGVKDCGCGD